MMDHKRFCRWTTAFVLGVLLLQASPVVGTSRLCSRPADAWARLLARIRRVCHRLASRSRLGDLDRPAASAGRGAPRQGVGQIVARRGLRYGSRRLLTGGLPVALIVASGVAAQTTKVPSTLRHGSGLMDIPVAGVLANRAWTVTYSGFWTSNDTDVTTDASGDITGTEAFRGGWNSDLAVARGLFDLLEFGVNIQSLGDTEKGGTLWGAFGRLSILSPQTQPIGLAVGGRYASSPDFGDGILYAPNRLGTADRRLRRQLGSRRIDTGFSFYAVAGWDLPGLPVLPFAGARLLLHCGLGKRALQGGGWIGLVYIGR